MPMGDSPLPKSESSANWPGQILERGPVLVALEDQAEALDVVQVVLDNDLLDRHGHGHVGVFHCAAPGSFFTAASICRMSRFTGHWRTHLPQPVQDTVPAVSTV